MNLLLALVFRLLLALLQTPFVLADPPCEQLQPRAELAYSPPQYPSPWMDPEANGWEDAYAKAKDFVSQLTLLEKVNITTGTGWMSERCVGNVGSIPRLGFRGLCMQDGPLGIRLADYNSAFPTAVTAGATWSRHLWKDRGIKMGAEFKGKGIDVALGPAAGPLGRMPEGGRNWEGFAVDPYLAGVAFAQTIRGIQQSGVVATAKHWLGNEQEHHRIAAESRGRGWNISESLSSNIDDKTLHEVYAWPFQDAVKAGVGAFMCSYTQINNSYGCQNSKLTNGILKGEFGFQGFVMSDWQAQHAGVDTATTGLDMTMPGDTFFNTGVSYWGGNLTLAVINGTVPEWRVDDMAMRIMAAWFKVGNTVEDQIDINFSSWSRDTEGFLHMAAQERTQQINFQVDVRDNHASHIRESAAKGTVLLKNEGSLPLNKPKFVAVFGEDAGPNPAGPNGCSDRGCASGTLAMGWGSGTAEFPYLITPDSALQQQALKDGSRYESVLNNSQWDRVAALAAQPHATAIVFANAGAGEGYISVDGNNGDRKNLTLWKNGDELIKRVAAINPNTIVVLHTVGPVLVKEWYENPNITAIVWAGVPGQESGNSITDILYGKTSPGRSPFTWGPTRKSYGTDVLYEPNNGDDAPQQDFTEGAFIDYRHFDKVAPDGDDAPIYEFGFGLSWSTFEYSNLQVEKRNVREYKPTTGKTIAAPSFGNASTDMSDYTFPEGFHKVDQFIYPWISTAESGEEASGDRNYGTDSNLPEGAQDGSPQPKNAAGGQPGGNPQLWDVLYSVTATITNTGNTTTDEVPQLYLSHGGEDEPVRVLRGFERIERIAPGQSVQFKAELTRRDVSNWDVESQNWVITKHEKTIWVGSSSRKLPLSAKLS
jgi:beta-glucosidase